MLAYAGAQGRGRQCRCKEVSHTELAPVPFPCGYRIPIRAFDTIAYRTCSHDTYQSTRHATSVYSLTPTQPAE